MERVAVLGLGLMGSALARAFVAGGRSPVVWNRSAARCEPFEPLDATIAASVLDAVEAADVVVVCVRDYDVTATLLDTPEILPALTGKTVVQLSTGTPGQAREAAAWAADHDVAYLDGAIMAFPNAIGTESAVVLYSGPSATFERVSPLVADFGGTQMLVGDDSSTAAAIDNGLLSMYYGVLLGTLHGAGICDSSDVPQSTLRDLATALMPTLQDVVIRTLDMVASGDYRSDHSTIGTTVDALGHIAAVSREAGLDTTFVTCAQHYATGAAELGHAQHGPASMFEVVRAGSTPGES